MNQNQLTYLSRFLGDSDFIHWRLTRTIEEDHYWDAFIREHPDQEEAFKNAIEICNRIAINKKVYADIDSLYQRILQSVLKRKRRKKRLSYSFFAVTAILLTMIFLTFLKEKKRDQENFSGAIK